MFFADDLNNRCVPGQNVARQRENGVCRGVSHTDGEGKRRSPQRLTVTTADASGDAVVTVAAFGRVGSRWVVQDRREGVDLPVQSSGGGKKGVC